MNDTCSAPLGMGAVLGTPSIGDKRIGLLSALDTYVDPSSRTQLSPLGSSPRHCHRVELVALRPRWFYRRAT